MSTLPDRLSMGEPKYKKKPYKKGKLSLKKLAKELGSVKKQMKEEVEVKSFDGVMAITGGDWSGQITTSLFAPQQGVTRVMRIGNSVNVTGIDFRYAVQAGITTANQAIRVILLRSKENTTGSVANVLETSYLGTVHAPYAFFNRDKRGDFEILHDETHEFDLNSGSLQQWNRKKIKKQFKVEFAASGTNIETNALYCIFVSNVSVSPPTLQLAIRTYYTDQ